MAGARFSRDYHHGAKPTARAAAVALLLLLTLVPSLPDQSAPVVAQEEGPGNLLRNPSFERAHDEPEFGPRPYQWSVDPWRPPDGTEIHQDHENARGGFFSAKISSPPGTAPGSEVMWYQRADVGGGTFGMGGWVRADLGEGGEVLLRVRFGRFNADNSSTWELVLGESTSGWVELARDAEQVAATERAYFQCVLSGPGTVWFDDVWLGEPSDLGNPPFIFSVPPLDAAVGEEYTYRVRAVDMEGPWFDFDLYRGPEGMNVTQDGDVSWTPTHIPDEAVKVVIRATDISGLSSYQDFFLRVSEEPVQRPLHVFAYSTLDDPFNDGISTERYDVLLPMLDALRTDHPEARPSVNVLLSGADLRERGPSVTGSLEDLLAATDGSVHLGYTAYHEPNYQTSPTYDLKTYGGLDWEGRVKAMEGLIYSARDPSTGEPIPSEEGGIHLFGDVLGDASSVTGVGLDGAHLHALDRFDPSTLVLGIDDRENLERSPDQHTWDENLVSMLSEDVSTPYGVYWQGGRLKLALDEVNMYTARAEDGISSASTGVDLLDRRYVSILPVHVMGRSTYCNGSWQVGNDAVVTPTVWGYKNPSSPELPDGAVFLPDERNAAYHATCSTLDWLAGEVLSTSGGRFLSPSDVESMVDPGRDIRVSGAELATAADDLIVRRDELAFPEWVGISWGYCRGDYQYFSLADMYGLLVQALAAYRTEGALPTTVELANVLGPRGDAPPSQPWNRVYLNDILEEAAQQAEAITDDEWRADPGNVVPTVSSPGGIEVNGMEFLLLMAASYMALFEGDIPANPLVNLLPTSQWPVTRLVLDSAGRPTDTGDSWTLKPASANTQVDEEPPQVRYVTPGDGSVNVPLAQDVIVTFSERMDETADLTGALTLDPPVEAELRWLYHRLVLDPLGNLTENTTYTATLGTGLTDAAGNHLVGEHVWSFTTTGVPNLPPVITPYPEDPSVEVEENQTVRFSLYAEDEGPPPLSFEWWIDGVRLAGENGDQLVLRPTYTDAGEHTVTVVVADAHAPPGVSTFTWNLTVVNVNVPPVLLGTSPPEGDVEALESPEGEVRFSVSAEDPDEGVLNYQWSVDDRPVNVSQLPGEGAMFDFPIDHESAGEYAIVCWVTDRVAEGFWVRWTLTVEDVNRPPTILGIEPSLPPTVASGRPVLVKVNATDPDGDTLAYVWRVDGLVAGETDVPQWSFVSVADGSFSIEVTVEDGRGGNATAGTMVNVLPEVEPQPQREPTAALWLLALVVVAAIGLALLWPRLRSRLGGE